MNSGARTATACGRYSTCVAVAFIAFNPYTNLPILLRVKLRFFVILPPRNGCRDGRLKIERLCCIEAMRQRQHEQLAFGVVEEIGQS